jgi:hypothetical protein
LARKYAPSGQFLSKFTPWGECFMTTNPIYYIHQHPEKFHPVFFARQFKRSM